MNQPSIHIIILNWNGYSDTFELINSLLRISYTNYKILIIDNNSTKNDVEKLIQDYGNKINIITCENNLGFAGGNNVGIKYALEANADFVLLLNNDTTVESVFLDKLLEIFEQNNDVGISAPQINYYHDPQRVWSAGGKISKIRSSGFADSNKLDSATTKQIKQVEFVSGCCMLIRREVFETIGLFDEKYFLYIEDTDLCLRTNLAGFRIYINPQSKIYHKVSGSSEKYISSLPIYYSTRNRLYFARKNYFNMFFLTCIYLSTAMLFKSLIWIFTGNRKNAEAVKNAFKDFFTGNMGKANLHNFICI